MFDVVFVKTPITSYARIDFATKEIKRKSNPDFADGPININRKLPAGDAFDFRDVFGKLPEYFQMLLIAFGMLLGCFWDTFGCY